MNNHRRLTILQKSLAKKQKELDRRLSCHFDSVAAANGQPLNDKRNGLATMSRWERQNDSIRSQYESIEKTNRAIANEERKIERVQSVDIPAPLRNAVEKGEIVQWRKHPTTFFVNGVERGRIVWLEEHATIGHRYLSEVTPDQYPIFRDIFNRLRRELQAHIS